MQPFYLYKPWMIFLLIFIIDKIFLLPAVKKQVLPWKKIEPAIYESREELFQILLNQSPADLSLKKKTGLILGTSRSGWFSRDRIKQSIPNGEVWNFSAPLAGPAWHYYWLNRILEKKITISWVIMEADPILFANESLDYSLSYSFDSRFIISHLAIFSAHQNGFSMVEIEEYFLKQSFALYKYPLNLSSIYENQKEILLPGENGSIKGLDLQKIYLNLINDSNYNQHGSLGNPFQLQVTPENLQKDAVQAFNRMGMQNFVPSSIQRYFFKLILSTLAQRKIPIILFRPPMSKELDRLLTENPATSAFLMKIKDDIADIRQKFTGAKIIYLDLQNNSKLKCKSFTDSHHLSGVCYDEMTDLITHELQLQAP